MDRTIVLSAAILVGWAVNSSASDEAMNFSDFNKIEASNGVEVIVEAGKAFLVTVDAKRERDLDRLVIRKEGDTLHISQKGRTGFTWGLADLALTRSRPVEVSVEMPKLVAISASSGSDVEATGPMGAELLAVANSGSDLSVDAGSANAVVLEASSGAHLSIEGACEALTVSASSGADVDASQFVCGSAIVKASSGSQVAAYANEMVIAKAHSGGDIRVQGDPRRREISKSIGGEVRLTH